MVTSQVLYNYKKDRTPFWNDLLSTHVGDSETSGVTGYDVAFLREARDSEDVDYSVDSQCFHMKRRLTPHTGEVQEGHIFLQ